MSKTMKDHEQLIERLKLSCLPLGEDALEAIELLERQLRDTTRMWHERGEALQRLNTQLAQARAREESKDKAIRYAVQVYDAHAQCKPTSLGMNDALDGLREVLDANPPALPPGAPAGPYTNQSVWPNGSPRKPIPQRKAGGDDAD